MDKHVCLEIPRFLTGIVTLCAVEWCLSCMDKHLCLKVTSSCEGVFTHYESERFFSQYMCLYVRLEVSSLSVGVIALCECVSMCVTNSCTGLNTTHAPECHLKSCTHNHCTFHVFPHTPSFDKGIFTIVVNIYDFSLALSNVSSNCQV